MVTNTNVVLRVDSSQEIATGHLMRCLTLARELRKRGARCCFVTRAHPGHSADRIAKEGFEVSLLAAPNGPVPVAPPVHAEWAGVSWEQDLNETRAVVVQADLLIVDHYALDARWQRGIADRVGRIMVIDDLADRPHAADLLLDQNLGRHASDYDGLVPGHCLSLIGPMFALLRPEFAEQRAVSLARRDGAHLSHLMISMGGTDAVNATGQVLDELEKCALALSPSITIVMNSKAPFFDNVHKQLEKMSFDAIVRTDIHDMASLMTEADLAIGAAGGTAWERCCLGLPTLIFALAANQRLGAQALHASGAGLLLGEFSEEGWKARLRDFINNVDVSTALKEMSNSAGSVTDGLGCERVVSAILGSNA